MSQYSRITPFACEPQKRGPDNQVQGGQGSCHWMLSLTASVPIGRTYPNTQRYSHASGQDTAKVQHRYLHYPSEKKKNKAGSQGPALETQQDTAGSCERQQASLNRLAHHTPCRAQLLSQGACFPRKPSALPGLSGGLG